MVFYRKVYAKMLRWKEENNGSTALLIKGARRIGKSTIAEEFARREYESYILIDFSKNDNAVIEAFSHIADLNYFFLRIQSLFGVSLTTRKSVIIFDEVQLFPPARQAIKHLVKDGRYDYIETGSLLSIKKNIANIIIPSEETRITMCPMDYEEFLYAIGKKEQFELIKYSFNELKPLGEATNRELMRIFRLYLLIGGMPQAINAYLETNDFSKVDAIKRSILELYVDDFRRVDPSGRLGQLFKFIPSELSRNTTRYKVGSVIENATANRLSELLMDMADSLTVNFAYHANDPNVGFSLNSNSNLFKIFLSDTGLFVTLAFMDREYTENDIYCKLLNDKTSTNLGYVYENAVAQSLKSSGNELYYYTFKNSGDSHFYEIDFMVSQKDKICPIEVKSSSYNAHKSLDIFFGRYSSRILNSYVLHTKDLRREGSLIFLPVYMASLL